MSKNKNKNKKLSVSQQEKKRETGLQLIRKGIKKETVLSVTGISERTYYNYRSQTQRREGLRGAKRKAGSGGHSKLSPSLKLSIKNFLRANPFLSTRELAEKTNGAVSHITIDRYLFKSGFRKKFPSRKFHLEPNDYDERLKFAKSLVNFIGMAHIVFEDESTMWLHDHNVAGWFHKDQENPLSIEKHEGKISICGAIRCYGKVFIKTFQDNLDSRMYADILRHDLIPNANRLYPYGWWLAQDNSPNQKGEAKVVKDNEIHFALDWPARSPDLNPIENLWHQLKQNVRKKGLLVR